MLYRYQFSDNVGFLTGLEEYFSDKEILSLSWIFERDLALPNCSMNNTKSYFTENGNRKFRKAIRKIRQLAEERNIDFFCVKIERKEIEETILYEDVYQVIISEIRP